jgi:hypothetical protein
MHFMKRKEVKKESHKKKGEILIENVVFILLNAIFLFILVLFLIKQGQGTIVLEQVYAKEIALLADSAKPGMLIKLDMEKALKVSEKNEMNFKDIVKINGNIVQVKLSPDSGYSYSFFNDVNLNAYPDRDQKNVYTGLYVLTVARN